MQQIYNAEDIEHARVAVTAFANDYAPSSPRAVEKITGEVDVLLEFYLPGRALGAPADHQPDRVDVRHRQTPHEGHQGSRFTRG